MLIGNSTFWERKESQDQSPTSPRYDNSSIISAYSLALCIFRLFPCRAVSSGFCFSLQVQPGISDPLLAPFPCIICVGVILSVSLSFFPSPFLSVLLSPVFLSLCVWVSLSHVLLSLHSFHLCLSFSPCDLSAPFDVSQESPVTPQNHLAEETAAVKETRLRQGRFTLTQSHSGWVKLSKASVTFCPSLRTRLASQRTQVTSSI